MSSRTLYKHVGSKPALIAAVLTERDRRFMRRFNVHSVDAIFAALEDWIRVEGARGCLFLRAHGETGGDTPEIVEVVMAHKTAFRELISQVVAIEMGGSNPELTEQVLVLFEGATASAIYRGPDAVLAARSAARTVVKHFRAQARA